MEYPFSVDVLNPEVKIRPMFPPLQYQYLLDEDTQTYNPLIKKIIKKLVVEQRPLRRRTSN